MPVNPALSGLAKVIESGQPWPRPACPKCQTGYIRFSPPTEVEGHESASMHSHPAFDQSGSPARSLFASNVRIRTAGKLCTEPGTTAWTIRRSPVKTGTRTVT